MHGRKARDFLWLSVITADDEPRPFVKLVIREDFEVAGVAPEKFEGPQFDRAFLLCARELAIGADDQNAFGLDRFLRD